MDEKQTKAKKSYLNKLGTAVRGHVKEVFTDIIKKGVDNAEELHGVKVNTQQKLDDILKAVYTRAKKDSGKLGIFAKDVKDTVKMAYKQAISAALREADNSKGNGEYSEIGDDFDLDDEDFLKEFDIDFDEDDFDDDDNYDKGNESYISKAMRIKPPKLVSNESNFVWSLESFDKSTLAGTVILFINKCLLFYKTNINNISLSNDDKNVISWIESKISTEEGRASLISLLSTVDHGISVPDATVETTEMVQNVLTEAIPPAYMKRVGLEDEINEDKKFDMSTADEEVLRELIQLGGVAKDILEKFDQPYQDDEAINATTMAHELLIDLGKMYNISMNNNSDYDRVIIDILTRMTNMPYTYLEKAILIDAHLVDQELIDTARQAMVLFSNILNK